MSRHPPAPGGGITVTTAGAGRILYYDAAGTALKANANFRYDEALGFFGVGGAPDATSGLEAVIQAKGNANNHVSVWSHNASQFGQAGGHATALGSPEVRWGVAGSSAGANFLETAWAAAGFFKVANGELRMGTTGANAFKLGINDLIKLQLMSDGSGANFPSGIGWPLIVVSNANRTLVAAECAVEVTGMNTGRTVTLPQISTLAMSKLVLVRKGVDASGSQTLTIAGSGGDTVQAGYTTRTVDRSSVLLFGDKSGTEWKAIAQVP